MNDVINQVLKRAFDRYDMEFVNPSDDVNIEKSNLNQAFLTQAGKFVFWSTLSSKSRVVAERAKNNLENYEDWMKKILKSDLDAKVRLDMEMNGEKITEGKVETAIYREKQWKDAVEELKILQNVLAEHNEEFFIIRSVSEAMEMRKDLLISLSANLRAEYNPHID